MMMMMMMMMMMIEVAGSPKNSICQPSDVRIPIILYPFRHDKRQRKIKVWEMRHTTLINREKLLHFKVPEVPNLLVFCWRKFTDNENLKWWQIRHLSVSRRRNLSSCCVWVSF